MTSDQHPDHHGCEATWVTPPHGHELACGKPATKTRRFEGETLLVCDRCDADLRDFEKYRIDRAEVA
jgi:hypothetical protein